MSAVHVSWRGHLDATLAGQGSRVLIGGEAGTGKPVLAGPQCVRRVSGQRASEGCHDTVAEIAFEGIKVFLR